MLTGWWKAANTRPVPNTASPHPGEPMWLHQVAGRFTRPPLGWCLHVVVGNGSPFETFRRAPSPNRRFSTGWVAKDGRMEQYAPFEFKSWAQGGGNPLYWSWETEGFPSEPLTAAQIDSLARFHILSGTADRITNTPGEAGIIVHYAGGAAWGGHSCPDPSPGAGPRSKQRAAILARARELRQGQGGVTMAKLDDEDRAWLAAQFAAVAPAAGRAVHSQRLYRMQVKTPDGGVRDYTVADALLDGRSAPPEMVARAVVAALPAGPATGSALSDADVERLADKLVGVLPAAVLDELARRAAG